MANHYLRYKYYLCTRMVAEELYIAVKDIFASLEFEQKAKISDAHNVSANIDFLSEAEFGSNLSELLKICLDIAGTVDTKGNFKISPSEPIELSIPNNVYIEQSTKLNGSRIVKAEHNLDFVFKQTAMVLQHIFYPQADFAHTISVKTPFAVGNSAKTKLAISRLLNAFAELKTSVPVEMFAEGSADGESMAQISIAVPYDTFAEGTIIVPCEPLFRLIQSIHIGKLIASGECNSEMLVTINRITKLSDFDNSYLSDIDEHRFIDLDITEQN